MLDGMDGQMASERAHNRRTWAIAFFIALIALMSTPRSSRSLPRKTDLSSRRCRDRDVPFLNYFPEFVVGLDEKERKAIIDRYFIRGDVHWNAQGNQLVADKFLQFYRQGLH